MRSVLAGLNPLSVIPNSTPFLKGVFCWLKHTQEGWATSYKTLLPSDVSGSKGLLDFKAFETSKQQIFTPAQRSGRNRSTFPQIWVQTDPPYVDPATVASQGCERGEHQ